MAVTVLVVDEPPLIVAGLASVLQPFGDRIRFAGADPGTTAALGADLLLRDDLAVPDPRAVDLPGARRVVFSWVDDPPLVRQAFDAGADGFVSKAVAAEDLVDALERIHRGERVARGADGDVDVESVRGRWPGDEHGLSARESEVLGLVCQGMSNAEIGATVFVSINTVKTYIRSTYRKIGVATRPQAVIWGMQHGFAAQQDRGSVTPV